MMANNDDGGDEDATYDPEADVRIYEAMMAERQGEEDDDFDDNDAIVVDVDEDAVRPAATAATTHAMTAATTHAATTATVVATHAATTATVVATHAAAARREDDVAAPPTTPLWDVHINAIRDFSMEVDTTVLARVADEIHARWVLWPANFAQTRIIPCAYGLYGFSFSEGPGAGDTPPVSKEQVDALERDTVSKVLFVYFRFVREAMIDPAQPNSIFGAKFVRALETVNNMASLINLHQRSRLVTDSNFSLGLSSSAVQNWAATLSAVRGDREESSFQKLLLFLLKKMYALNLRKYNDRLYKQTVITVPGQPPYRTHAWELHAEFDDFVYGAVCKESDYDMWLNLTSAHANVTGAVNYLKLCRDYELPMLKPDRHVFSFTNGVYDADANTFYAYADPTAAIPPSVVACKFFNIEFPIDLVATSGSEWRDIPTPKLDQILDHQRVPNEPHTPLRRVWRETASGERVREEVPDETAPKLSVKHWFYVFIGRMIYEIGEYDEWQVLMFIKGVAGSGKSTLGKFVSYLYEANDVGVLSNNIENKFGLAALVDKLIYVCYEVKHDFGLDQGEFQCMVSGEQMAIPKKFETAKSVAWKTHGMFMGNEVASWCDNSGSMSRRILLALFNQIVTDGNPKLFAELQAEMAFIILKANCAYRNAADAFGMLDIWNVLPPYFSENRRKLRAETHALAFFLENCTDLEFGPHVYMSMDDLKLMMNVFLMADGLFKNHRKGFTSDFYQWVFDAYHIRVDMDSRDYKGAVCTTNFLTGVCDVNNRHALP